MRAITLAIAACLILGAYCSLTPSEEMVTCVKNISLPCSSGNSDCTSAWTTYSSCLSSKCSSAGSWSDVASCATGDCKSSNSEVATYQTKYAECVSSSIITISIALFATILALF